jgi:hypothetical protein
VNPFSNGAIGALIPDKWSAPTIPAFDLTTLSFDPKRWLATDDSLVILGFVFSILPRSLAVGWMHFPTNTPFIPLFYLYSDLSGSNPGYDGLKPPAALYSLIFAVIGTSNTYPTPTYLALAGTDASPFLTTGFNCLLTGRYEAIRSLCAGARIIGAGLRVKTKTDPATTSGRVHAGWLTVFDLYTTVAALDNATLTGISPADLPNYLTLRKTTTPLEGTTVRYSALQSPIQATYQTLYPETAFPVTNLPYAPGFVDGVSPGANDVINSGDYIPTVFWEFNTGILNRSKQNPLATSNAYVLQLEIRVHLQCQPLGICPFNILHIKPDTDYLLLVSILDNADIFNIVTKDPSFPTFIQKFCQILQKFGVIKSQSTSFSTYATTYFHNLRKVGL